MCSAFWTSYCINYLTDELSNSVLSQVSPEQISVIIGSSHTKKLKIINTSAIRQNFHILEPLNVKTWSISFKKPSGGLIPGETLEVTVRFTPPSNIESIYQDSIRLHSAGGNLLIPLYAYPTIDASNFPEKISFGSIPLGQDSSRVIRLDSPHNEKFEYRYNLFLIPLSDL